MSGADIDFASLMEPVARRLLGEPNEKLSKKNELRYGANGSLKILLKEGMFFDFETKEGGGVLDFIRRVTGSDPMEWLQASGLLKLDDVIARFDYQDENGTLLFQVCRTQGKRFWQRKPDGKDGWRGNVQGVRRVLYRLPELFKSSGIVLIPEGEKHVDALLKLGLCATCNSGGAGKWLAEYNGFLAGRDVVILPDNDEAGIRHAQKIAAGLYGVASRVRVLVLRT